MCSYTKVRGRSHACTCYLCICIIKVLIMGIRPVCTNGGIQYGCLYVCIKIQIPAGRIFGVILGVILKVILEMSKIESKMFKHLVVGLITDTRSI